MKKALLILTAVLALASCQKDDAVVTYTVTFDTNGGAPSPQVQTVNAGDKATAPANPTKQGYVFLFWHLNGATSAYNFGTPVTNDIVLQAKWEDAAVVEYWQVSWGLNGGTWPATGDNHATQVVKGGTLAEPAAPVKSGVTFDGWYKESALTNKVSFPYDVSSITSNFTLYAKWSTGGNTTDPEGYKMFTSLAELSSWLTNQSANTPETPYKIGLKSMNLDEGNNWWSLGAAISSAKTSKFVNLKLDGCTGTTIPDGYLDIKGSPPNVTITTYGVFIGCTNLIAISLPNGLKIIGKYAFNRCSRLDTIILPQGLASINSDAFIYCGIRSITLPEGLKDIGGDAFSRSSLTSVTIPGSVKNLSAGAFMYCDFLVSITVNEGVESIGRDAFLDSPLTSSIKLPASLKRIDEGAFSYGSFTTITVPSGVETIGEKAFSNNSKLTQVIMLPIKAPSLPPYYELFHIFYNVPNLSAIKVPTASLNAYKTASVWYNYASKIIGSSE